MQLKTHIEPAYGRKGGVVCTPVGHDVSLETKLAFGELVQRTVIFTRPGGVNLICALLLLHETDLRRVKAHTIAAHNARDPSHYRVHEWVGVDLV